MSDATTGVPDANASVRTMPKLSPPSDGAQSRSASCSRRHFSSSLTRPSDLDAVRRRAGSGATSSRPAPATVRRASTSGAAQRLEGAQQHRQALALLGAADEQQVAAVVVGPAGRPRPRRGRRRSARSGSGRRRSARRPARRLGHRDPHVELVVEPPGAEQRGQRSSWEPASWSRRGRCRPAGCAPTRSANQLTTRRVGLVHVHHVVAADAQLAAEGGRPCRADREVRDRAVGGQADGAPERDQRGPAGSRCCGRTPRCSQPRVAVVRVVGRQQPDVVSTGQEARRRAPPRAFRRPPDK